MFHTIHKFQLQYLSQNYSIYLKCSVKLKFMYYYFYTGNGYIPTSSLREILRELDEQLTEEELDGLIQEIDTDGSGTVDFDGNFYLLYHNS